MLSLFVHKSVKWFFCVDLMRCNQELYLSHQLFFIHQHYHHLHASYPYQIREVTLTHPISLNPLTPFYQSVFWSKFPKDITSDLTCNSTLDFTMIVNRLIVLIWFSDSCCIFISWTPPNLFDWLDRLPAFDSVFICLTINHNYFLFVDSVFLIIFSFWS